MTKMKVFGLVAITLSGIVGSAIGANLLRFDFGPSDGVTEPGYIHVNENTIYNSAVGYGIYDPNEATGNKWSSTRTNAFGVYKDFVCMGNQRHFRADVDNGDYYVTVIAGDPANYQRVRFAVEGVVYGWTLAGGVIPAGAPLYIREHTPFVEDMDQIEIPASAWRDAGGGKVRVLGYNVGTYIDEDSKKCEYLVLDQALITVLDGQINIENCWDDGNLLNAVIIEKVEKQPMRFDFGPAAVTPIDGFIRVSHETVYSPMLGYGIFHYNTNYTPTPRSVQRGTVSPYPELRTFVDMSSGQRFQVDVPNGNYYVTVVAGDSDYTYLERLYINGSTYTWSYADGLSPAGIPLYLLQHTGWTTDLEKIAIPQSSWRSSGTGGSAFVRVLGYNTQTYTDEDNKHIEFLMLDKVLITVTDGQLRIENNWGTGNKLNYVEIIPATCEGVIEAGYTVSGDFNKDCAVDLQDFAVLAGQWMLCNDPQDESCVKNW